jgi:hypothetical protein
MVVFLYGCGGKVNVKEKEIAVSNLKMPEIIAPNLEPLDSTYKLVYDDENNLILTSISFKVIKTIHDSKIFKSISLNFIDSSNNIIETNGRAFNNRYSLESTKKANAGEVITIDFSFSVEKVNGEGIDYEIANRIMESTFNLQIRDVQLVKNEDYIPPKRQIYALNGKKIQGLYGNCFELVDTVMEEGFINLKYDKVAGNYVITDKILVAAIKPNQTNRCFLYIDFYDKNKNKIKELVSLEDGGSVYNILKAGEGTEEIEFCSPINSNPSSMYEKNMDRIYYFNIRASN